MRGWFSLTTTLPCNQGDGKQLWHQEGDDTHSRYINAAWGNCLDGNGNAAYTLGCNNDGWQDWRRGFG